MASSNATESRLVYSMITTGTGISQPMSLVQDQRHNAHHCTHMTQGAYRRRVDSGYYVSSRGHTGRSGWLELLRKTVASTPM